MIQLQNFINLCERSNINRKTIDFKPDLSGHDDYTYILRAIYINDIRPLYPSKIDYNNYGKFLIHKLLLNLSNEFRRYDLSYGPVYMWAEKRIKNSIIRINQIRHRYWYFKPLKF